MFDQERIRRVYEVILLDKILRNTSFLRVCNEIVRSFNVTLNYLMHDYMEYILGDIFFGTATTESKNIVKLLAISQTIHTMYCKDNYFPKPENLNY